MTRQGTGLQLNEDLILWSLCGRNQVKGILTETKPSTVTNGKSDQRINQSADSNSLQERNILESHDTSTTKDRMVMNDSLAWKTFPQEVQLCWSSIPGYKLGVMATASIPQGVWIGPYQGKLVQPDKMEGNAEVLEGTNLWEIFHENQLLCYVDGSDVDTSGWMRFIQCARSHVEQNLNAFQYQGNIYYRALRDIRVGEELLVWYDDSYPQYMGIPLMAEPARTSIDNVTHLRTKINAKRNLFDTKRTFATQEKTKVSEKSLRSMRQKSNSPVKKNKVLKLMLDDFALEGEKVLKRTQKHEGNSSLGNLESIGSISPDYSTAADDHGTLTCGHCSTSFSQRNTLQTHVCPKQTNSPYQCGYCNLSFTNPSDLRSHVVKHVSEKPFKCGFCKRSFVGSTTLNNHIRMHTGEKPFNCQTCGVTFSQGAQYARHLRLDCNGNVLTNTCESLANI